MPTPHRRIPVIEDEALAELLERTAPYLGPERSRAARLRDLAVRGAEQLLNEESRRQELLQRLVDWSTDPDGLDWQLLREIHERGGPA